MVIFLVIIIICLCLVLIYEGFHIKNTNKLLKEISEGIKREPLEEILVTTDNQEVIELMSALNTFILSNQKIIGEYNNSRVSTKKMISNISHDIKTPLTVISGYIEMLMNEKNLTDEDKKSYLTTIYQKNSELLDLVTQFFSLSKLESGDKELTFERINISEIAKKIILAFYDILSLKGFDVDIKIPEEDVFICANKDAMERVLNNLISNAIRYGADGKYLGITIVDTDESVDISILDRGKGISEKEYSRIFERLYTLEDSRNKNFQGSGLGLTITKSLVEKMNGEISVKSTPFKSTVFTVKMKKLNL